MSYKQWTSKLIVAMLCLVTTPVWAAQAPIILEANFLQYNDETGEIMADGQVKMNHELTRIYSEHITGNINTGDMLANGQITWTEENSTLTGDQLKYNYKTKNGQMGRSKGNMDGVLLDAQETAMFPDKAFISQGSITKCPAKIPDYKMTADKIEVYPGDKLIAHNVSFWIKNFKIFSLPKFTKSLKEKDNEVSLIPRVGYDSHDGLSISQHFEYPVSGELSVMTELAYYTQRGFEPQFGLIRRGEHSTISLINGTDYNDDREWYDRRPELLYTHEELPIGKLPFNLQYKLYTGRIVEEDTNTDLWRSGGEVYVSHTPIKLTDYTTLYLGGGYEYTVYENNENRVIWRGNVGIKTAVNERINIGLGYNHASPNGSTPFIYDDIDIDNELTSEFSWQLDRLWQVGVNTSYDLDNSEMADVDYIIKRNLHCFETSIIYREKRDEWKFRLGLINW